MKAIGISSSGRKGAYSKIILNAMIVDMVTSVWWVMYISIVD